MDQLLGIQEITDYGLYVRGIIITLYAIVLFRSSSSRLFGEHSPLDFIIFIVLGAILGEAIVNNIPLIPSMMVCLMIVAIHRLLAYLTFKSTRIGKYIKGDKIILIENGKYLNDNLTICRITENDILQALRQHLNLESIDTIKMAILERSGQISFIARSKD